MSRYRFVHTEVWADGDFSEWEQDEKLFFLYLLTNPHCKQCGIYKLPTRIAAFECGIAEKRIRDMIAAFVDRRRIAYNHTTSEVAILNWLKYNNSESPKVKRCVYLQLDDIKDKRLIELVYRIGGSPIGESAIAAVSSSYDEGIGAVSQRKEKEKVKSKKKEKESDNHIEYREFVKMSEQEFDSLVKQYGAAATEDMLDALNNYKGSNGKEYKSDYRAILSWTADKIMERRKIDASRNRHSNQNSKAIHTGRNIGAGTAVDGTGGKQPEVPTD